jgi:AMMECR1
VSPLSDAADGDPGDRELARLFDVIRAAAQAEAARPSGRPAPAAPVPHRYTVNITILIEGELRASMSGHGGSLAEAVAVGGRRAARDTRFGPGLTSADLATATIELWVQTSDEALSPVAALTTFDPGVDGIRLRRDGRSAYYKPSVPLTSGITRPVRLYRRLARKAGLDPEAWCQPGTELRRTQWRNYLENAALPSGVARLHRLRPVSTATVCAAELAERLRLACERMVAAQDQTGRYLYRYHPFTGQAARTLNLVRQAGCAFALALASAAAEAAPAGTPAGGRLAGCAASWRDSARQAAESLLATARITPSGSTYLVPPAADAPGRGTLGAVALLLLALQSGQLAGSLAARRADLITVILDAQQDDGSFRPDLLAGRSDTGRSDNGASGQNFYPGEALLALCREAAGGRTDCAAAISRSFTFYRQHFRRHPHPGFVLWQADTWSRACDLIRMGQMSGLSVSACADFVFEMAEWLLPCQQGPHSQPWDSAGGFRMSASPPGFSTSMYTEAIVRAYQVACSVNDEQRADRYRQAALRGLGFLFRLQISPDAAPLFRRPELAVGGTTQTLTDWTIRCDFGQHTITALLAAMQASVAG